MSARLNSNNDKCFVPMKKTLVLSLVITMISVMFFSIPTATAASPNLAGLDNFAILANTYTNNGGTIINGDFGYTVPPATFPTVNGATFPSPNPTYVSAQVARANLFAAANNPGLTGSCTTVIGTAITLDDLVVSGNPAGTLPPGIYCITGITTISNAITLSGDGVYIFRINGALNADPFSQIILSGAQADKIFWIPAATTLGDDSIFAGIILTDASITLGSTVSMDGRILSNGAVTTGSLSVITAPLVTITPPIVTITPPIPVPDDICNDCVPPTLGLNSDSVRRVDQGFSYNGKSSNVELILTPVKLLTTKIGDVNKAVFKIYEASGLNDPGGPDEVLHFELIFGLAKGQILGDGKAMIELDRSWDGVNTVKVVDPENSLKDVKVETSKGACRTADVFTNDCLIVTIYHTFV
ncbi:MAG TPA: ice-binding family protein, partial [Candidatus Nitrosotenuis sp.]